MKKTIAFALSLLMAGSLLLGGCGKTTGGKADNTTIDWLSVFQRTSGRGRTRQTVF